MNQFKELDTVQLKKARPDLGIDTNHLGAIVDVLNAGEAFTVEFVDENKETIEASLWTEFSPDDLLLVQPESGSRENVA